MCGRLGQFDLGLEDPVGPGLHLEAVAVSGQGEEADALAADAEPPLPRPVPGPAAAAAPDAGEVVPELEGRHPLAVVGDRDRGEVVGEGDADRRPRRRRTRC